MTYKPGEILRQVRAEISTLGASEDLSNLTSLQTLFDKLQDLREEMNEAKKQAAAEAAKPYLEAMATIESRYAFTLKMKSWKQ